MSEETHHLNFNRTIFVDGSEACQCVKEDAIFFEAAYRKLFGEKAAIQVLTTLQNVKRKQAQAEELEVDEEEASEGA
jgi:uncharacterized protein (UPF0305 family)